MRKSTMKKIDTYAFVGVVVALVGSLLWFFATHL